MATAAETTDSVRLTGRELWDREFPTTPAGYRNALAFLTSCGAVRVVGIEGFGSYGAGLARAAHAAGVQAAPAPVREKYRPPAAGAASCATFSMMDILAGDKPLILDVRRSGSGPRPLHAASYRRG